MAQCQRADEELKVLGTKSEPTLPTKALEGCPASVTTSRLPGSDGLPTEGPITKGGS